MPRKVSGTGPPEGHNRYQVFDNAGQLPQGIDYFTRTLGPNNGGVFWAQRIPSVVRLIGGSSDDGLVVDEFRRVIHEIKYTSLEYVQFEKNFQDWQNLWSEFPTEEDPDFVQKWRLFLRQSQGRQLIEALFSLTEKVLRERPNWGGVLLDCHRKVTQIYNVSEARDKMYLRFTELQAEIVHQVGVQHLVHANSTPHGSIPLMDAASMLHDAHHQNYGFNLVHEMFRFSLGNPLFERSYVREWLELLETQFDKYADFFKGRMIQLSRLTDRHLFGADNALTVRDYAGLLPDTESFLLVAMSTLFPSDVWTKISILGFYKRASEDGEWNNKSVLEIGTGKGILPLFLAEKTQVAEIDSVDVNQDSQSIALLNTYLRMATTGDLTLKDRIRYYLTDNLDAGAPSEKKYDVIIGCIPQAPTVKKGISDRAKADVYPETNYPEDIDGFGLLALMLERGFDRLNPGGEILLTVSGRPGLEAIIKMSNLRGYVAEPVVEEMILQHKGTDLSRYVEIENSRVRPPFEFWVEGKKITAVEAKKRIDDFNKRYAKASHQDRQKLDNDPYYAVSHKLFVIRFQPLSNILFQITQSARQTFENVLNQTGRLGYFNETGTEFEPLGIHYAEYLSSLVSIKIDPETLFLAPNLNRLIANYLHVTAYDKKIFLDPEIYISSNMDGWFKLNGFKQVKPLRASVSIWSPKNKSKKEIEGILAEAVKNKKMCLFLADSSCVNEMCIVAAWVYAHPESSQYISLAWVNLQIENPLAAMILPNRYVYESMQKQGKDTYSRISTRALSEYTFFDVIMNKFGIKADFSKLPMSLPRYGAVRTNADNTGLIRSREAASSLIDLSFGESEYLIPSEVRTQIVSVLEAPINEDFVGGLIVKILGLDISKKTNLVFGAGVHPLIQHSLEILKNWAPDSSILLPTGHYGQFPSTIRSANLKEQKVDLEAGSIIENLEKSYLEAQRKKHPVSAILLQYPVNPSGRYYTQDELKLIVEFARSKNIYLLVDEIFFETGEYEKYPTVRELFVDPAFADFLKSHLVLFGGTSKDMGWGMARFGYVYSENKSFRDKLSSIILDPPDSQAMQLASLAYEPNFRLQYLQAHRSWLSEKRREIIAVLGPFKDSGVLDFKVPEGGYFVEVDVSSLFGKSIHLANEVKFLGSRGEHIRDILKQYFGIIVSRQGWSGKNQSMRLVYSIQRLTEALNRLTSFFSSKFTLEIAPNESLQNLKAPVVVENEVEPIFKVPEALNPKNIADIFRLSDPDLIPTNIQIEAFSNDEGCLQISYGDKQLDESSVAMMIVRYQKASGGLIALHIEIIKSEANGQARAARILNQLVHFARATPTICKVSLTAVYQGRFAFSYLDGFTLSDKDLLQIRKRIKSWAKLWRWPIVNDSVWQKARSPYLIGKIYDLGRVFTGLISLAMEAYDYYQKPGSDKILKTRFPGQVALMLMQDENHNKNYGLSFSVRDDESYARFLASQIRHLQAKGVSDVKLLDSLRRELEALHVQLKATTTLITNDEVGQNTDSFFISEDHYKNMLITIDGAIVVSRVLINSDAELHRKNVVLDYQTKEGKYVGSVSLDYIPDPKNPDKWIVSDSFIYVDRKLRSNKYGIELRSQLIRFHHTLEQISGWLVPVSEDGIRLWKHLDGVVIKKSFLERVRHHLGELNSRYNIGFDVQLIRSVNTIWDFTHKFLLPGPHLELQRDAAKAFREINYEDTIELTKNVGELALRLALREAEQKGTPLQGFLDLTRFSQGYNKFLDSLMYYWSGRSLAVARAKLIVADLKNEKQIMLDQPKIEQPQAAEGIPENLENGTPSDPSVNVMLAGVPPNLAILKPAGM